MKVGITRKVLNSLLPKPYYQTKLGKLYHGDCLDILPKLDVKVDLVLTDPPYGVDKAEWDEYKYWLKLLTNCASNIEKIIHKDGVVFIFCATRFIKETVNFFNKVKYRWQFIWHCSNNMIPGDMGFAKYTSVLIFSNAKSIHRNIQDLRNYPAGTKELKMSNHPTPKPLQIVIYLLNAYSNSNEEQIILDPFLGSGTTAVACEQLNRRWIGIEISEKYCEIAAKRIEQESKRSSMRLSNKKTKSSMKKLRKE